MVDAPAEASLWGTFNEATEALRRQLSGVTQVIDQALDEAIRGDIAAARSYVGAYLEVVHTLSEQLPTEPAERHRVAILACREAISLPFRARLVGDLPGLSISMSLLSDMRDMTVVADPLVWPEPRPGRLLELEIGDLDVRRFERTVDRLLDRHATMGPLEEVVEVFDLSYTDAGRLFGVTRQAVAQWLESGVPADRAAKVTTVAQVAELLRHHLLVERIPGIARKHAEDYGGLTMLDMVEDDRHDELLDITRRSFDWATTA